MLRPPRDKIDVLISTLFSIIWTDVGNDRTVWKGSAIWYEGQEYGRRPLAPEDDSFLRREADIYDRLGEHDRITRSYGLEFKEDGSAAWGLRLERAPGGALRMYIINQPPPSFDIRLRMALEFAEGVEHLHARNVRWLDLSTRNALLFDDLRVKLCDFTGGIVPGIYEKRLMNYELRYTPPESEKDWGPEGSLLRELFALGTAIYEITEWRIPYGLDTDELEVEKALNRGDLPEVSGQNSARSIISRCWAGDFRSAEHVATKLREMAYTAEEFKLDRLRV